LICICHNVYLLIINNDNDYCFLVYIITLISIDVYAYIKKIVFISIQKNSHNEDNFSYIVIREGRDHRYSRGGIWYGKEG